MLKVLPLRFKNRGAFQRLAFLSFLSCCAVISCTARAPYAGFKDKQVNATSWPVSIKATCSFNKDKNPGMESAPTVDCAQVDAGSGTYVCSMDSAPAAGSAVTCIGNAIWDIQTIDSLLGHPDSSWAVEPSHFPTKGPANAILPVTTPPGFRITPDPEYRVAGLMMFFQF